MRPRLLFVCGIAIYVITVPVVTPGAQDTQGTGRISGIVTTADTGDPIRYAAVRLSSSTKTPTATALTDENGHYEFGALPAGRYTVAVSKAGFIALSFGQTPFGDEARRIQLTDGEQFDQAHIKLPRGGVLSGRVSDGSGDAVVDAYVQVFRAHYTQGVRRLTAVRGATTNDLGQYRVYGLPAGAYYVSAVLSRGQAQFAELLRMLDTSAQSVTFSFQPPGTAGFAPTFYPGGVSTADARPIRVQPGQETPNVDFMLQPVRLVRLSGRVVDSRGQPLVSTVMLAHARADRAVVGSHLGTQTNREGAFTLTGIVPGDYRVHVRGTSGGNQNADTREFASLSLSIVAGADVEGLVLSTSRGRTISGRVVVEGGVIRQDEIASLRVITFDAVAATGASGPTPSPSASVQADATFQIRGLAGTRLVRVERLPDGWALKAVRIGGVDVTDAGFEITADVTDAEVIVARPTQIRGSVVDSQDAPIPNRSVIVFAEDSTRWTGFLNRYITSVRTSEDGAFYIAGLPPGPYFAAVSDPQEEAEWMAPEHLDRLRSEATRFTLAEAEQKVVRLGGGQPKPPFRRERAWRVKGG